MQFPEALPSINKTTDMTRLAIQDVHGTPEVQKVGIGVRRSTTSSEVLWKLWASKRVWVCSRWWR
jgi:hypothetical protein